MLAPICANELSFAGLNSHAHGPLCGEALGWISVDFPRSSLLKETKSDYRNPVGGARAKATSQAAAFLIKTDPSLGHLGTTLVINELNVQWAQKLLGKEWGGDLGRGKDGEQGEM